MNTRVISYTDLASEIAQYIFDNVSEDIRIDTLAEHFGVSKYHLNRIFHSITGFQLGQHIQRQRLNQAFELLTSNDHNVIDTGLAVGYESHSSFTRAFVKAFGFKPSEVKQNASIKHQQANVKNVAPKVRISPTICDLPTRKLVGLYGNGFRDQTFLEVANKLYESLNKEIEAIDGVSFDDHPLIGVSIDSPWKGEQERCRFFAGLDLNLDERTTHLPNFRWQSGTWARFVHKGPYRYMWQTISQVYSSWVVPENVQLRDSAIIQAYVNNPQTTPAEQLETHLYFGIE